MRVVARRSDGFAHDVEIEGGHTVLADEPTEMGGTDTGPSPTRLLAASLAACTAVTIEMYAERKGWDVGAIEVEVDVEYDDYTPSWFGVSLRLPEELDEDQRERLLEIATKCPVHKVIAAGTPIGVSDEIDPL